MSIEAVARHLATARRVLFVTGAGVSADSGIPTYRGIGGLYEDREVEDGRTIEEILSGPMFRRDPSLTWRYIAQIEKACRDGLPNSAHTIIAELESAEREVWILTQNVDGLHRRAGSTNIIDIHGDVYRLFCPNRRCDYTDEVVDFGQLEMPPPCPSCGAIIRPDVVLFEELLPEDKVAELGRQMARGFDLVFSVGTSSLFPYIVQPVLHAAQSGAMTVEINPSTTTVSGFVQHHLALGAADAMTQIAAALNGIAGSDAAS